MKNNPIKITLNPDCRSRLWDYWQARGWVVGNSESLELTEFAPDAPFMIALFFGQEVTLLPEHESRGYVPGDLVLSLFLPAELSPVPTRTSTHRHSRKRFSRVRRATLLKAMRGNRELGRASREIDDKWVAVEWKGVGIGCKMENLNITEAKRWLRRIQGVTRIVAIYERED